MKESFLKRLLRKVVGAARRVKQFSRNHPWQMGMLVFMLFIIGLQGFMTFSQYQSNASEKTRVLALDRAELVDLNQAINDEGVDKIIRHTLSTGTILQPETKHFLEVVKTDGASEVIEESAAASEEIWKGLVERAFTNSFALSTGYQADRDDRLAGMLRLLALLLAIIMVLVFAQMMMGEVLSGKSFKVQRPDREVMLDDVIGHDKVKASLREVMDQLIHAKEYASQNIVAPKGILFTGDPGVGKTMLGKALANELGADFFAATGADFAEMYVGVGPKRVRALFRQARQSKLALVFIDEIDAIGNRDEMGSDTERRAVINALLAELDGMEMNGRLLVIGATNHLEKLDVALRRRGRFDRIVHIPLPSRPARKAILEKYLEGVDVSPDVDLDAMALRTKGYSGAQLAGVAAEAKNLALREKGGRGQAFTVTQAHLHHAQEIEMLGESGQDAVGDELLRVTVHELGHALTGHLCVPKAMVEKVTVRGRGGSLGATWSRPLEESLLVNEEEFKGHMIMALGGRAAEEVFLGNVSNGAIDDLRRATSMVRSMVLELGMGPTSGLVARVSPDEQVTDEQAQDMRDILNECYERALAIVREHQPWFKAKTEALLEKGMLAHDALFEDLPGGSRQMKSEAESLSDAMSLVLAPSPAPGPKA